MNMKVLKGVVLAAIMTYLISLSFASADRDWSEMIAWICSIMWAGLFHYKLDNKL